MNFVSTVSYTTKRNTKSATLQMESNWYTIGLKNCASKDTCMIENITVLASVNWLITVSSSVGLKTFTIRQLMWFAARKYVKSLSQNLVEIHLDQEGEDEPGGSHTELDDLLAEDVPATAGVDATDGGSETHDVDEGEVIVTEDVITAGVVGDHMKGINSKKGKQKKTKTSLNKLLF